jgi:putative DNA primase/helicase
VNDDLNKIIHLAARKEQAQRTALSEDSVALAFAGLYRGKFLFDHDVGAWFQWDGAHWKQERTRLAFEWVRQLARELSDTEKNTMRARIRRVSFANGVEKFAQADRAFAVTSEEWDTDPFLLGTPGGTVELRAGTIRAADPADRISKLTAVVPAGVAECPRWLAFLKDCTGGDPAMIRFLQQWCGYSLTGATREHAFVFCYGPGKNGKTTFIKTVSGILGDYAITAAMTTFTTSKFEPHPTDLAALRGARMVTASETEEGRHWAEVRIKQLTGGDQIAARFMRQDYFNYTPTCKLTIIGNHAPNLHNVDEAMRCRINIVPFTRMPPNPDKELFDKLRAEWPAILRWMLDGCLDWQANELTRALSVTAATANYFENQDLFGQWLEDKCDAEPGNEFKTATSAQLFESWSKFAQAAGEEPGTRKGFASLLERRGFVMNRTKKARLWQGLRLTVEGYDDR